MATSPVPTLLKAQTKGSPYGVCFCELSLPIQDLTPEAKPRDARRVNEDEYGKPIAPRRCRYL